MSDDRVLGVERGEGRMPHVVIENAPDLAAVFRGWCPSRSGRTTRSCGWPTEGVKRLLALIAVRVRDLVPASRFGKTNLEDYLP
jgi:hypothetical protein